MEDLGKGKGKGEGAWQEKGVVFLRGGAGGAGVDTPMHTMKLLDELC